VKESQGDLGGGAWSLNHGPPHEDGSFCEKEIQSVGEEVQHSSESGRRLRAKRRSGYRTFVRTNSKGLSLDGRKSPQ